MPTAIRLFVPSLCLCVTFSNSSVFAAGESVDCLTAPGTNKWALWACGTRLRGANIWQAVVVPELDGDDFKGTDVVGPPYAQTDFDALAALGANYVVISGPGLYTEQPPYILDEAIAVYMDGLVAMISEANMYVSLSIRTGPGRSEYGLCCLGDPYYDGYFNDSVWQDAEAQDAWVAMWRDIAQRYRDNPVVVAYELMVEPNNNELIPTPSYDPEEFYAQYRDSLYDWNQLYPRLVEAIRSVDTTTPILVGGSSYSAVSWLPYIDPLEAERIVYVVHQYEPQASYSHQEPAGTNAYPGLLDLDDDGELDEFDRDWLQTLLTTVFDYSNGNDVPVVVNEFGAERWVPGAAQYVTDHIEFFEELGVNHAVWEWQTSWPAFFEEVHSMDYRLGPDPDNRTPVENELMTALTDSWALNTHRPFSSDFEYPRLVDDDDNYWDAAILLEDGTEVTAEQAQLFRVYYGALGRAPDTDGFDWWIAEIEAGRHDLNSMAAGFICSDEFLAHVNSEDGNSIDNEVFLNYVYRTVFGREPDVAGFNWWLQILVSGEKSNVQVLVDMTQSNEYAELTLNPISQFATEY